jgi:hypothetical protein
LHTYRHPAQGGFIQSSRCWIRDGGSAGFPGWLEDSLQECLLWRHDIGVDNGGVEADDENAEEAIVGNAEGVRRESESGTATAVGQDAS